MKDSVYKNKGGKYTSAPARAVAFFASQKTREVNTSPRVGARIFYFVKNKGGKYASAPARAVAFFTS